MTSSSVKRPRRYDATGRRRAAAARRDRIVGCAHRLFLAEGYAGTTVAAVAADAGVSVETVYKAFGGKTGLVRAVWDRALQGTGPTPAEHRSDAVSSTAEDPRQVIATWARLSAEVGATAAPVLALVRAAALVDPEAAELLREIDAARLRRMTHNAEALDRGGHLRPGLDVRRAAEIMVVTSGLLYEPLMIDAGWSEGEYVDLVERLLAAALLG